MPESPDELGTWLVAPDGLAHCIAVGKCLCGAGIDAAEAPRLRVSEGTTLVTPLCMKCVELNASLGWKP
jgi:hypothetical protein